MDKEKLENFITHVREASKNPDFVHHQWFVKWHLEIVEKIALELAEKYPEVDMNFIKLLAWLHDYGKILDYDNQYEATQTAGKTKLLELGFSEEITQRAVESIKILDSKLETDLHEAPIEVQIVSSADGCSHMVGPFLSLWWYENSDKDFSELMKDNRAKIDKDWNRKIVLPEARKAFQKYHDITVQQAGELPTSFLND